MGLKQLLSRMTPLRRSRESGNPGAPPSGLGRRANRVGPALADGWELGLGLGTGAGWTPLSYGEYYARSAPVYSAIKLRQDAVAGVPLRVCGPEGRPVEPGHPARRLLDRPNAFWTRGDLWRATETYLGLWGSAYWGLERDDRGQPFEMWPLRPDRVRVVPDPDQYVKGFVYVGRGRELVPYAPDDVVWLRYFNPLDEYAGLSPVAPLRLSIDMGLDALQASRNSLTNDSTPGIILESSDTPTDDEVREFYERWEARFKGPDRVRRPVLLSGGMKASGLGFSPRDMEYVSALRWSVEDVSRVYGVPKPMLGDMERITYSNFRTARRVFWEDTIVPQLAFYREALERMLRSDFPHPPGLLVEFDLSGIEALRDSENDRARRRKTYVDAGIMTADEARQEMGLPPLPATTLGAGSGR